MEKEEDVEKEEDEEKEEDVVGAVKRAESRVVSHAGIMALPPRGLPRGSELPSSVASWM